MIENFYPNPIVVQRLHAGPLSVHIDAFAQQLFDEGYALWTVKYSVRLLADLTTWMQEQGLTIPLYFTYPLCFWSVVGSYSTGRIFKSTWRISRA